MTGSLRRRFGRAVLASACTAILVASGAPAMSSPVAGQRSVPAPLLGTSARGVVPGEYLVVLREDADAGTAARLATRLGGRPSQVWSAALPGFAARLPEAALAGLRRHPAVEYVEADRRIDLAAVQSSAPWGLDRIDQRNRPLDGAYRYSSSGAGVTAYVIDSGIRRDHRQFGGRVRAGYAGVRDGRGTQDCNGHGTHVAGTIGASRHGVAKKVILRPVRVLDCQGAGRVSGIVAGLDWVARHHRGSDPAVANLSLVSGRSTTLDRAVRRVIGDRVTVVVAGGNAGRDACGVSPARVTEAITVGASTRADLRADFSNIGGCLDLFAPGVGITSTYHSSPTATRTFSGTSMAAPHVTGVAARYLQTHSGAAPSRVASAIRGNATEGLIMNPGAGSPNRLLDATFGAGATLSNQVRNGSFEYGAQNWTQSDNAIGSGTAHSGSRRARLGGTGKAGVTGIAQAVWVPAGRRATYSFWVRTTTDEPGGNVSDRLQAQVLSRGSTVVLATVTNADADPAWVRRTVDLSGYAGRWVTVRFVGLEDNGAATTFLVDDVVLRSS